MRASRYAVVPHAFSAVAGILAALIEAALVPEGPGSPWIGAAAGWSPQPPPAFPDSSWELVMVVRFRG